MTDLPAIAKRWHKARDAERVLATQLYDAIRKAHADGMPETEIASVAKVNRGTVRQALGKRRA
jgi:DNA invertase Pin-like site-specific DNA recombinase